MKLGGQGGPGGGERPMAAAEGYAMAALLIGMSVMAIVMGAALPVWNKQAQREREEEYLFRAYEYARAIRKFQARAGPGVPVPSFDVLVQQRFLRRKYKDPITGEDFQPVYQTAGAMPGSGAGGNPTPGGPVLPGAGGGGFGAGGGAGGGGLGAPSGGLGSTSPFGPGGGFGAPGGPTSTQPGGGTSTAGVGGTSTAGGGGTPSAGTGTPVPGAGIIGVVSKSKATSIKIFNGRTRYDQWAVTWQDVRPGKGLPPDLLQALNAAGAAAAGGAGAFGQPAGAQPPGANPFAPSGAAPFGASGGSPFAPGANPFAAPGPGNPFGGGGQPVPPPAGAPPMPGASPFSPAYPPPPGGGVFTPPPRKR